MKREYFKILVETTEDLVILDGIIKEGDLIGGKTVRTIKYSRNQEKIPVYLKISVEKKKFDWGRLRITGKIVEGPEEIEKGYHTFEIKEGTVIDIFKKLEGWIEKKIKESERFKKKICAVTLDYGRISVFEIRNYDIKEIFEKRVGIPGKKDPKLRKKAIGEFLKFVERMLESLRKEYEYIFVLGNKFLLEKIRNYRKIETPHYGIVAVKELLRRGEIIRMVGEMDIANAWSVYEEFLERMSKGDERVCWGEDVKEAAREGRVEKAVFTKDIFVKDIELLKEIEEKGGKYYIVDENTEVGHLVKRLGGIALLRF